MLAVESIALAPGSKRDAGCAGSIQAHGASRDGPGDHVVRAAPEGVVGLDEPPLKQARFRATNLVKRDLGEYGFGNKRNHVDTCTVGKILANTCQRWCLGAGKGNIRRDGIRVLILENVSHAKGVAPGKRKTVPGSVGSSDNWQSDCIGLLLQKGISVGQATVG